VFFVVFCLGVFVERKNPLAERLPTVSPSHFILCPEMKSAVGVYGGVKAEGPYLRVNLTEDATSALLIGPDCLIVPDVREDSK
jgi:hypothetical protein